MALQPHRQVAVTRPDSAPWLLRLLTRNRYQLIGATLVAVILPILLRNGFDIAAQPYESSQNTLVGTFLAMLLGTYLLRRITAYPGVSTVSTSRKPRPGTVPAGPSMPSASVTERPSI